MMKKAFTLIELLTVMAITAVMLTLIVLPIFQSFNLTRTAQAFVDAQDKARLLTERIAREVGNAVSVRDAASTIAVIPGYAAGVELPYTKLDLIPPAQGSPDSSLAAGTFRDPDTGKIDPTLTRPKGDINLPVRSGATLVRWFVGQRDPSKAYNEPYTGLLMARNGTQDNLFVLRRAEVQPFVYRSRKDGASNSLAWRPNLAFFRSDDQDPSASSTQEFDTRIVDLDDPRFFLYDGLYLGQPDANKNARVANWVAKSTIQTEISRYDMIRPALTGSPPQVDKSAAVPIIPLVQFRPTRVAAAPAEGSAAARPGEAIDGLDRIGPDTFKTERGLWTDAFVRYYPSGYAPSPLSGGMEIASVNAYGAVQISNGATSAAGLDGIAPNPLNYSFFDAQTYEQYLARGQAYPFTAAVNSADVLDTQTPLGYPGQRWTPQASLRALFTPFRVLTGTGKIVTSFGIEEVGTAGNTLPNPGLPNLPIVTVTQSASPTLAGNTNATAPLSPTTGTYDPNQAFNRLWNAYPELQTSLQRFIDLRFVPNQDGTPSPLCPVFTSGATGFAVPSHGSTVNRVRIVPGSDEVYGVDQLTAVGTVRYTRVTGNPGPNQYRLVYADLPEPTNSAATDPTAVDYSTLGLSSAIYGGFDPAAYDGTNVVSAAIQPRYKAGYLQLDSDPNFPLPVGPITVKYRFQLNGPGDTFAVDLDTREVMQILLTIKNYPQTSLPNAQTITLKSTATLRNALR